MLQKYAIHIDATACSCKIEPLNLERVNGVKNATTIISADERDSFQVKNLWRDDAATQIRLKHI